MSYSLHVMRNSGVPISRAEWNSYVERCGLRWVPSVSARNPRTGEVLKIDTPGTAILSRADIETVFHFSNGKISVSNPSDEQINVLRELASEFSAVIEGDEGEIY